MPDIIIWKPVAMDLVRISGVAYTATESVKAQRKKLRAKKEGILQCK